MNCSPHSRQNQTFGLGTRDVNTDFRSQLVDKIRGIVVLFLAGMFPRLITDFFYSNVFKLALLLNWTLQYLYHLSQHGTG